MKSFKDHVASLGASSVLFYEEERAYKSRWKVFASLPFWQTCSNSEWEYMFLGFAFGYSAESRSLILSRGFDFVGT